MAGTQPKIRFSKVMEILLWLAGLGVLAENIFLSQQNQRPHEALAPQMDANNLKEVLDYGQTKKAVCDALGTDFVRIVPYGPGAAQSMFECVLADLYEHGEGLSRRSGVPSRRTCSSSGLRPRLYVTTVIADAVVADSPEPIAIALSNNSAPLA